MLQHRYSKEAFASRGRAYYEHEIGPALDLADAGKFVAIDIETGEFEVDRDDYNAIERMLSRYPNAQVWLERVGQHAAYRIVARREPL